MIEVDGKIKDVPPNGHSVTNVREFKIGEESYIAVIDHYSTGSCSSITTRFFKEVSKGFVSTLPVFDSFTTLKESQKENKQP